MRVEAFLTEYAVVDRIIRHLELTFIAEKPPPACVFEQPSLMADASQYSWRPPPPAGSQVGAISGD